MIAGMHATCRNFAKGLVAAAGLSAVVACAAMDVTFDGENTLLSIRVGAALPRFRAQAEMGGEGACKVRVGCGTAGRKIVKMVLQGGFMVVKMEN